MSKERKITAVDVEYGESKGAWVSVHWDRGGKPNHTLDGTEVYNRSHNAYNPKRVHRLIKLGRRMQDILLNQITEDNDGK